MLKNLTPHDIVIRDADGKDTTIPKSGSVARVVNIPGKRADIPSIPCEVFDADSVGGVEGLPEPEAGIFYLVSGFVGSAVAGKRDDVLVPGTGPKDGAIRNEKGWIVAVTRLKRV